MSLFLFKPHVEGPSDAITSPDVIIDRLFLAEGAALSPVPTSLLTSDNSQQAVTGVQATPFYALTSLGGGIIISPGVKLGNDRVIVARKAWRLNNLSAHTERLTLNGTELADLSSPEILISHANGKNDMMPRGLMIICAGISTPATGSFVVQLADPVLGRTLNHRLVLEDANTDRWVSRPIPRYSTGPTQREVDHYI